ncbi:arginine N-succinyltransferase [Roseateles sp. BYS87W]|uniref:Arginine N-succinyltransferase n=1 Tax=Pelomonas baiyunensis TaxID=3299026 RepID=A0ABW7H046_9BURK
MSPVRITPEATGLRLALPDGIASLRLVPRLGLTLPRHHFRLGRVVHAAAELNLFRVQTTLLLGNDHTGHAELTDLHTAPGMPPAEQTEALGRLIQAAQAQLRERPADFGPWLVAELPGWLNAHGHSPFWQALGARFYAGDPAEAERRLGPDWRSHLAALLPRQTVYLSFLGAEAESRVLQVPEAHQPALTALRAAGFHPPVHARIDDGGPVLAWPGAPA